MTNRAGSRMCVGGVKSVGRTRIKLCAGWKWYRLLAVSGVEDAVMKIAAVNSWDYQVNRREKIWKYMTHELGNSEF